MESSMQVTPGFGAGVSTKVLDNKHNQNVVAHADGYLGRVIPAATAVSIRAIACRDEPAPMWAISR